MRLTMARTRSRIWELVGQKEAFVRYVQDEVRAYLGAA